MNPRGFGARGGISGTDHLTNTGDLTADLARARDAEADPERKKLLRRAGRRIERQSKLIERLGGEPVVED